GIALAVALPGVLLLHVPGLGHQVDVLRRRVGHFTGGRVHGQAQVTEVLSVLTGLGHPPPVDVLHVGLVGVPGDDGVDLVTGTGDQLPEGSPVGAGQVGRGGTVVHQHHDHIG